jgi:hypothetical protein
MAAAAGGGVPGAAMDARAAALAALLGNDPAPPGHNEQMELAALEEQARGNARRQRDLQRTCIRVVGSCGCRAMVGQCGWTALSGPAKVGTTWQWAIVCVCAPSYGSSCVRHCGCACASACGCARDLFMCLKQVCGPRRTIRNERRRSQRIVQRIAGLTDEQLVRGLQVRAVAKAKAKAKAGAKAAAMPKGKGKGKGKGEPEPDADDAGQNGNQDDGEADANDAGQNDNQDDGER